MDNRLGFKSYASL